MAKKTNDAPDNKKDIEQVAGDPTPDKTTSQVDNQDGQETAIPPASDNDRQVASGDGSQGSGDSAKNGGEQSAIMDTETKDKGTGEQGADIASEVIETKSDQERARIAKDIFAKNSKRTVLYFTSDMMPFFNENDAIKHTRDLSDKTIVPITKQ